MKTFLIKKTVKLYFFCMFFYICAGAFAGPPLSGGDFAIARVAGVGGGRASGGDFAAVTASGQHGAGALAGGTLELTTGFFGFASEPGAAGCLGDADLSGFVNGLDYAMVTQSFGETGPLGDADLSGFVNGLDYPTITEQFGESCDSRRAGRGSDGTPSRGASSNAQPASFRLDIALPLASIGHSVEVDIVLSTPPTEGAETVRAAGVFLSFDDSRLRFEEGEINNVVWDRPVYTGAPRETEPGVIAFPAGSSNGLAGGEFLLATLRFTAISPGEAPLVFLDQNQRITQALDAAFNPVATSLSSATIVVKTPEAGIVLR